MKKIFLSIAFILTFSVNAFSGSDGSNNLSKKNSGEVKDCFESLNRGIFAFNQVLDSTVFEPLAKGYRYLPSPIRTGSGNFVSNLSTLVTIPNNLLQGDIKKAGKNTARFAINSSVGVLGLFDVASAIGIKYEKEDYGQTLATWGVKNGCYVVLPVLGPSTIRDAAGTFANFIGGDPWYNVTVRNDTHYFNDFDFYASRGTSAIDFRSKNIKSFDSLEENSIDFYASVKSLYLQDRRRKIDNSNKITDAMDDSDWEEIENK